MATNVTFFPVGNGDMTLISLGDSAGTNILIDCNIRAAADDPKDATRDVAADLHAILRGECDVLAHECSSLAVTGGVPPGAH